MIDVRCKCGRVYHANEDYIGKMLQCVNPNCREFVKIERPAPKSLPSSREQPSSLLEKIVDATVVRSTKRLDASKLVNRLVIACAIALAAVMLGLTAWDYYIVPGGNQPSST